MLGTNNNFNLSLADSLSNSTYGNNLSQLVYNKINSNTGANSVLTSLNTNLQGNPSFVSNVVNTMTSNVTYGNPGQVGSYYAIFNGFFHIFQF